MEDDAYIAEIPELSGCMSDGATAREALENVEIIAKEWIETAHELGRDDGNPLFPDTINYWLKRFLSKNNLPHITPHGLRHTFATLQITSGIDISTLQARTGHAQASTLINIYARPYHGEAHKNKPPLRLKRC